MEWQEKKVYGALRNSSQERNTKGVTYTFKSIFLNVLNIKYHRMNMTSNKKYVYGFCFRAQSSLRKCILKSARAISKALG